MEDVSGGPQDVRVKLANGENPYHLDHVDDLVYLFDCAAHAQRALDRLTKVVAPLGICVALSKREVLLQDGRQPYRISHST